MVTSCNDWSASALLPSQDLGDEGLSGAFSEGPGASMWEVLDLQSSVFPVTQILCVFLSNVLLYRVLKVIYNLLIF